MMIVVKQKTSLQKIEYQVHKTGGRGHDTNFQG